MSQITMALSSAWNDIHLSFDAFSSRQDKIYDTLGPRVVRTLVDSGKNAGMHEVRWDGSDGEGHRVASGIYLYRL